MNAPLLKPEIEIEQRAFIFGGAYGNLQATRAILEKAWSLGYLPHEVIFTGDTVAYCGQPVATVHLIRKSGIHAIMGNCEEALVADADNCGCGFEEGTTCNALSAQWYQFCREQIDMADRRWMATLPRSLVAQIGQHRFLCTHATPKSINEFVFLSDIRSRKSFPGVVDPIDGFIVGHSGIPFLAECDNRAWINSGAAGMPANDGTPRVWYATIESTGRQLSATISDLEYDHEATATAMVDAGLQNGYQDCLKSGLWPSLDVLPATERQATGTPVKSETRTFLGITAQT